MLVDDNVFLGGEFLHFFILEKHDFETFKIFFLKKMTLFVRVPLPTPPLPFEKIKFPQFYYRFQQVGKT
jgi:hypothetical protein